MRICLPLVLTTVVLSVPSLLAQSGATGETWPGFRGDGTSHTRAKGLPLQWSDTSGVAWRMSLDGHGQSGPVIWRGAVYVTAVTGIDKETLLVSRVDLARGTTTWTQRFRAARKLKDTDTTSKAAPTPVVNEDGVFAMFESGDVIALAHDGRVRWQRSLMDDYGDIKNGHQYGSSPVLVRDGLLILIAHGGPSYLLRLDAQTGATLWKVDRPTVTSWHTPIVGGPAGDEWVAVPTKAGFDAHRFRNGEPTWSRTGVLPAPMASATRAGERLVVPSSTKGGSGALAPAAERPIWVSDEATADFSSPLVVDDVAYFVNPVGVLYASALDTGETLWKHRLPGACWASAVFDGRHAYFFGVEGKTVVMTVGRRGARVVAENTLKVEGRVYGVAAVNGALILRTDATLLKIAVPEQQ